MLQKEVVRRVQRAMDQRDSLKHTALSTDEGGQGVAGLITGDSTSFDTFTGVSSFVEEDTSII